MTRILLCSVMLLFAACRREAAPTPDDAALASVQQAPASASPSPSPVSAPSPEQCVAVMDELGIAWKRPWQLPGEPDELFPRHVVTPEGWKLLSAEAAPLRNEIKEEEIDQFLKTMRISQDKVLAAADRHDLTESGARAAVRAHLSIVAASEHAAMRDPVSEQDIDAYLEDVGRKIEVRFALLDADPSQPPEVDPSEDEIAAFFEAHKSLDPAESPDGFGYLQPWKVRVEYVKISAEPHESAMEIEDKALRRYWQENRHMFGGETDFATAREQVLERMRDMWSAQQTKEAADRLRRAFREPWDSAAMGVDGFRVAPAEVKAPGYFEGVVESIEGMDAGMCKIDVTSPLTFEEISKHPVLGAAFWNSRRRTRVALPHIAFHIQGRYPAALTGSQDYAFALYEPLPAAAIRVRGVDKVWVIARVIDLTPPQPPESREQMREKVVNDLKASRAYDRAGRTAAAFAELAAKKGLESLWEQSTLRAELGRNRPLVQPAPFARKTAMMGKRLAAAGKASVPTVLKDSGMGADFVEACFAFAVEHSGENQDGASSRLTKAIGVPKTRQWAIVELVQMVPPAPVDAQAREAIRNALTYERYLEAALQWFAPDQIRRRAAAQISQR